MRSILALDPLSDFELHAESQERRRETALWILVVDDVLDVPVIVDGYAYDASIEGTFTREGENGPIEIHTLDFRFKPALYLMLPGIEGRVAIDHTRFEDEHESLYKRVWTAIEAYALKRAKNSNNWEMEDGE